MCRGTRLIADFVAGTEVQPDLPDELAEHLTTTVSGLWVVWAYKLARSAGDLFVPLTGGPGYPADARAECRHRGIRIRGAHDVPDPAHNVPDPGCTCGFHALSTPMLTGLPARQFPRLTVALSGRVLAFEWHGSGVLWRAERQTVVCVDHEGVFDPVEELRRVRRDPGDPGGSLAAVFPVAPRDSGPVRLDLPVSPPRLPVCHDDAGWCLGASTPARSSARLVLA